MNCICCKQPWKQEQHEWLTQASTPDSDSTIWTVRQQTSHRSTASIQAGDHSGFDGHREPLPSDWLIGIHALMVSRAKPVGTVLLIKWPKTLAVSLSCECGASGVSGDSGWLQISSDVCRNNRSRVSSLLPSCLRCSPPPFQEIKQLLSLCSITHEDRWSQTANVFIHLHPLPIMDLLRTINKRKLLKVSKTINLSLHLWHGLFCNNAAFLRNVFCWRVCVCVLHVAVLRVYQETCWSGVSPKTWTWTEWSSKPSPAAPTESPPTSCECARRPQPELVRFVHAGQRAGGFTDTLGLKRHPGLKC